MRTVSEIKDKIKEGFTKDFFGFGVSDILKALPFEDAKEFLKEEFINKESAGEEWESMRIKTDEDVKEKMLDYLPFAWEKAEGERGLSADRSIRHFAAWAWLIDNEFYEEIEHMYDTNYAMYGKPILTFIGEKLGYQK